MHHPTQQNIKIYGEILQKLPKNLYIPPNALEVYLDHFEGPLDLLLYLIRSQGLSILDIPVHTITTQYLVYVRAIKATSFELAADYLAMAAILIDIKARMLIPRPATAQSLDEEQDPRAALVARLIEYERTKQAAQQLQQWPVYGLDFWPAQASLDHQIQKLLPSAPTMAELIELWEKIALRKQILRAHTITPSRLDITAFITHTRVNILKKTHLSWLDCLYSNFKHFYYEDVAPSLYVVYSLNTLLELSKEGALILMEQAPDTQGDACAQEASLGNFYIYNINCEALKMQQASP